MVTCPVLPVTCGCATAQWEAVHVPGRKSSHCLLPLRAAIGERINRVMRLCWQRPGSRPAAERPVLMMLLRALRGRAGGAHVKRAARSRARRMLRMGRRVAAGCWRRCWRARAWRRWRWPQPQWRWRGAAALSVAAAAPAKAATTGPVLVLLQNGESTAPETDVLRTPGTA